MKRISILLIACALAASAQAATPDVAAELKRLYPATQFSHIAPSPVAGLTEVVMGANVAYVDGTGRYFLFGHLYDMQQQADLTAKLLEQASRIDFAALPIADAIVTRHGSGRRRLAVFTDPDCPYCRALGKQLARLDDVTVYTFLAPIAALHPDAPAKAAAIWCAPDRAAALDQALSEGRTPSTDPKCTAPTERNLQLAARLGVRATPTLFAADGRRLNGAADGAALERFLNATD